MIRGLAGTLSVMAIENQWITKFSDTNLIEIGGK